MSNFQEVELKGVNITAHPNKPMTGFYVGTTECDGDYGTEEHHTIQLEKDQKRINLYGFTALNMKLARVPKGSLVRITYLGTAPVKTKKYGMKDVHQVKVEVDTENSIAETLPKEVKQTTPVESPPPAQPSSPNTDPQPSDDLAW